MPVLGSGLWMLLTWTTSLDGFASRALCCKQDIFGFQFCVWLFIFSFSIDLQRSGTRAKHVVFLTRDPWRRVKLLEKWVAFLKWCGCVYLGVDIIMCLWYSSCWVWNASVSKARRRARQKLGEKSEFQCLLPMVHGKVTILCLTSIFLKHWAYAFSSLWITVCEYVSLQHQNIRNSWVLCLGFTRRGRSLLQTLGSLMQSVFNYKASISAVADHGSLTPGPPESLEQGTCSPPPALPLPCLRLLHPTRFLALRRAQQRFLHEDWNVFI